MKEVFQFLENEPEKGDFLFLSHDSFQLMADMLDKARAERNAKDEASK